MTIIKTKLVIKNTVKNTVIKKEIKRQQKARSKGTKSLKGQKQGNYNNQAKIVSLFYLCWYDFKVFTFNHKNNTIIY